MINIFNMITYQIDNKPFIDLEPHLDMKGLEIIEKDIIVGIAKSRQYIGEAGAAKRNFYPSEIQNKSMSLLDISWYDQLSNPSNTYYQQYKELKFDANACKMFNRYMFDTIQMGQCLELRSYPTKQFHLKDSAIHCTDKECIENFPELIKWIKNIKILSEIGRIIFFFNSPHDKHAVHMDHFFGTKEQFILINLNPDKKEFFILDNNGKKLIVKNKAIIFDPRNYHGTEGKDYYSWSLRIDGKFTKEFLESTGLVDYFNSK